MATPTARLFGTVAPKDYLGFWDGERFEPQAVARFLGLTKAEVGKVAGVAPSSVRFDQKIPHDVRERLLEIANICGLVAQFFAGDRARTALWFRTRNPMLGNIAPRDMIRFGRYERLSRFVLEALQENSAGPGLSGAEEFSRGATARAAT